MSRIEKITELLEARPDDLELHYMLAMELRAAGDYEAAISKFDDCIRMKTGHAPAWFQKANTLIAAGCVPEARAVLEQGIVVARAAGDNHAAEEMAGLLDSLT